MAKIAVAPFMFRLTFSIGSDEYTAHLSQAEFTPAQPTGTFVDISGESTPLAGPSAYTLSLAGAQDWATANSLTSFLTENDAEEADVVLGVPGGEWAATVLCAATTIGGSGGSPAAFSVTLQSTKPVFTADTP